MGTYDARNCFREKADIYLEMIQYARDERQRRILHELFEENEAKAHTFETNSWNFIDIAAYAQSPDCQ
jgi:hypothetical protein